MSELWSSCGSDNQFIHSAISMVSNLHSYMILLEDLFFIIFWSLSTLPTPIISVLNYSVLQLLLVAQSLTM